MKKIIYSAPAKVIISGEHAVVYGKPALVSAIDLRLKFKVWESKKNTSDKNVLLVAQKVGEHLRREKIKFEDRKFECQSESEIPIGRGLGWSTAMLVAEVSALLKFYSGRDFSPEIINNLSYQIEKYFYKNTSGVDVTASTLGGLIYYRKEFEFLKNISALNFKIPKKIEDSLYLIDSGKPKETTSKMVSLVGKLFNQKPRLVEEVLNDIEKSTKRIVVSIIKEDTTFFQKSIFDNQVFLDMLGVVSTRTKKILKQLDKFGVGKVTGAGGKSLGSGFILFFASDKKGLEQYCKKNKIIFYKFRQSFVGVREET